jgi:hypothetical protein
MSTITGATYITDLAFVTTATTQAVLPIVDFDGAPSGVTLQFPISAITTYNLAQNTDELGGTSVRTLFASTTPVVYAETEDVDILSGGSSNFGSRNLPQAFFGQSGGYLSKKISFDIKGQFGTGTDAIHAILKIGNDILSAGNIGRIASLTQPDDKPLEILGNITITSGMCYSCVSLRYCDNSGNYRAYNLSNLTIADNITTFTGGNISLILSAGTNLPMTAYTSLIQIHN